MKITGSDYLQQQLQAGNFLAKMVFRVLVDGPSTGVVDPLVPAGNVEDRYEIVNFFHEGSHALVAWLTGGQVSELVVNAREGGHVLAAGGNRFLTLNAGYLGSLLWGVLIYSAAANSRFDRVAMGALAAAMAALSLFFASGLFFHLFGLAAALVMFLAARYLGENLNDFLLRLIGLTSMVYVPHDIYGDTIARSALLSDARMLAREYGGATVLWGAAWFAVSLDKKRAG